ncbi:hypothetical protein C0431_12320 [bacterium]|nr:hypothetical protein [bacterium]
MDKFKVPSTLHIEDARRLAALLEEGTNNGQHMALSGILQGVRDFVEKSNPFDPNEISPYANKAEIENLWSRLKKEMESIDEHSKALKVDIDDTKKMNEEGLVKVKSMMAAIQNLYTDAEAIIDAKNRIRTSSEFFLSDQNIDYDRISGAPLQIRGGSVALPYAEEPVVLNGKARVTIVPGTYTDGYGILGTESNGFPGNNHEVRKNAAQGLSVGAGRNGLTFAGESERFADLSAILDGDSETWFEYERVSIRPTEQSILAKGMGLDYGVTDGKRISYLDQGDDLKLSILITLDSPLWLNEVDIRPYVPTNYGARAAKVIDILVSKEYEPPASVLSKRPVAGETVFRFKPVFATSIVIKLGQDAAYPTDLGHIVYEVVKESEGQRLTIDSSDGLLAPKEPIQVEGPPISVKDMGYLVEEGSDGLTVKYGVQGMGQTNAKNMGETIRRLEDRVNPKERRLSLKRIEGTRKVIGVRDVILKESLYLDKGELVTKPIHFDEPLERITLEADATPERNEAGVEIKYHVSVDDGLHWHEIQPFNSELGRAPKVYRIINDDAETTTEVPVIRTNRPVYEVRFKMTMERVGVSGQSGPRYVPDTPQIFMYSMRAETKEKPRESKSPLLMPPKRLKGKAIGGNAKLEDIGGGGPSYEETRPPELSLTVAKEACHNAPMTVIAGFTHERIVVEAIIYLDGKEVYREIPGVEEKTIKVDIPTSYFAERSRVSVSAWVSDGISEARALSSVLVVPCQDVAGRDIDISASYPQVGEPWTVSGFAKSEQDIESVTLYVNGVEFTQIDLVWDAKRRAEFIKVFTPDELEALAFTLNEPVELKWVARDVEGQTWDDVLVIQYVDRRPPSIPCGQIMNIDVDYYDWNLGRFNRKSISVPNWDQEVRWFEDGRGIKTLISWNEMTAAPVLMVRNGIGETGGVIIGRIAIRYRKKLEDGTISPEETVSYMEGVLDSSMTEAMDLAFGDKELTALGDSIRRTGRFSGNPRLMGLNSYLIPDFGSEYRSNVCGKAVDTESFEPSMNILTPGEVEETGSQCESNAMFMIEYYDKTLNRRVLHGQKRDGQSPQETIFLPDLNEHNVILKWSDTRTGVAVYLKSDTVSGLVVTAIGVLVRSRMMEARYGESYISSVGYTPENQVFAVRKPIDPLEVSDMYADGEPVPELKGVDSMVFLGVKAREMVACAVDSDDPAVKPDVLPPDIEASTTLLPSGDGAFCLQDVPSTGMPLTFTLADDIAVSAYEIFLNGQKVSGEENLVNERVVKNELLQVDKAKYMLGDETTNDTYTVIVTDTSGKIATKTFKYRFKDCWTGQTEEMIFSKAAVISGGPELKVFDRSQYITFDQTSDGDTIDVKYRVRSGNRVTETGFNHWGTGITQVTGEYGPTIDVVYYSPSVEDTGEVMGRIPIPQVAGGSSYTVNQTILVEEEVTECVLVIDTRAEFMTYFNANKQKFVEAIQKDFDLGVEYMVKKLAYDPGQVRKQLEDIHWYYKSMNKKRFHIMTIGTGGVDVRTYEDPRTFSLDWVQARADAIWGGTTNQVFMDTLNKLKTIKQANSNAMVTYMGLTIPATTYNANAETLLRPVLDIVEAENVKIFTATTNYEGSSPESKLAWPAIKDEAKRTVLAPYTYVFSNVVAPDQISSTSFSLGLGTKVETKKIRTGVLRRYILRFKTENYPNFWQGGQDEIWLVVLDPAHTANYEYTNGYTDHRA